MWRYMETRHKVIEKKEILNVEEIIDSEGWKYFLKNPLSLFSISSSYLA